MFPGQDGNIAYVGDNGIVTVAPDGSGERELLRGGGTAYGPRWSPDGRLVAFRRVSADDAIDAFVMRADGSGRRRLTRTGTVSSVAWSHDGSRLLLGIERAGDVYAVDLVVLDLASGTTKRLLAATGGPSDAYWSPDGGVVAFSRNRNLYLARISDSRAVSVRWLVGPISGQSAWLPDAKGLAVTTPELKIRAVGLDGTLGGKILDLRRGGASFALSPRGDRIAYTVPIDNPQFIHLFVARIGAPDGDDIAGTISVDEPDWQPLCTIYGSERADVLVGTAGPDKICGLGGADTLRGLGGNDILMGGEGDDVLEGRAGSDWLFGGAGNDRLIGRYGGPDIVDGGPGDDRASFDRMPSETVRDVEDGLAR